MKNTPLNKYQMENNSTCSLETILTLEEMADFLRINRVTLLELVRRKNIPARQVGKQWRFSRDHVLAWLSGNDLVLRKRSNHERKT